MGRLGTAQPLWDGGPRRPDFQVSSGLVLVPVTVMDHRGANVGGLGKESFTVLDDGRPQPITSFYSEDAPCSVGLVIDASGSVKNRLDWEKRAAHAFLASSNLEDDVFVSTVSSSPAVFAPADVAAVGEQVRAVQAGGWTALFDTIRLATNQLKHSRRSCRALVALSDGMDNHSRWTKSELLRFLVESDIQVYSIAVEGVESVAKGVPLAESKRGIAFMSDLAERTGGLSVSVRDNQNPAAAAHRISAALRNRYVVGYRTPDADASGKWHAIRVKVDQSKVNVYARSGYRAQ
jgi:VWFA-related protein